MAVGGSTAYTHRELRGVYAYTVYAYTHRAESVCEQLGSSSDVLCVRMRSSVNCVLMFQRGGCEQCFSSSNSSSQGEHCGVVFV
jgi:hypothetical protein